MMFFFQIVKNHSIIHGEFSSGMIENQTLGDDVSTLAKNEGVNVY